MRNLDGIDALVLAAVGLVSAYYALLAVRLVVRAGWGFCDEIRKAMKASGGKEGNAAPGGARTTDVASSRSRRSRTVRKDAVDLAAFMSFVVILSAAPEAAATWATIGVLLRVLYLVTAPLREFAGALRDGLTEGERSSGRAALGEQDVPA